MRIVVWNKLILMLVCLSCVDGLKGYNCFTVTVCRFA